MNSASRIARRPTLALLGSILLGAMLFGCAAAPPQSSLPQLVVLAPINFDALTVEQLEAGVEPTSAMLRLFLRHNGAEVVRVPVAEMRAAYLKALDGAKPPGAESPEYAAIMGELLEEFSPRPADSVLVVPHLLFRPAQLVGTRGKWDGATRKVQVDNMYPDFEAIFKDHTRGVSLRIRVFSATPTLVHEGYGGIQLPFKFVVYRKENRYTSEMVATDGAEIFNDPRLIAHALKLAFDPYVPRG